MAPTARFSKILSTSRLFRGRVALLINITISATTRNLRRSHPQQSTVHRLPRAWWTLHLRGDRSKLMCVLSVHSWSHRTSQITCVVYAGQWLKVFVRGPPIKPPAASLSDHRFVGVQAVTLDHAHQWRLSIHDVLRRRQVPSTNPTC